MTIERIDPMLRAALDHQVTTASATFANGETRETLTDIALLTFAGLGLAILTKDEHGGLVWVGNEPLIKLPNTPTGPVELSQVMGLVATRNDHRPKLTRSLQLIMDDILKVGERNHPLWANIKLDPTLLILAGGGYVQILPQYHFMWTATYGLIKYYQMGNGIEGLAARRKQKLKMDSALKTISRGFGGMFGARLGHRLPRGIAEINTVLSLEWEGDAIAEIDVDGRLAWRASDDTASYFAESDDSECKVQPPNSRHH